MNLYSYLKPLIFKMTPEQAHASTIAMLRLGGSNAIGRAIIRAMFPCRHPGPVIQAFGLTFPNPLGMAAGYDKDGFGWRGLACLGFGHIELGTVTPRPQPGNPSPRIFRLVDDRAVINRMGFPNRGAAFLAARLQGPRPKGLILGVNIGKNKDTPLEEAGQDYLSLARTFTPLCDYLAVNVSSPNTPGLRTLQSRQALESPAEAAGLRTGFAGPAPQPARAHPGQNRPRPERCRTGRGPGSHREHPHGRHHRLQHHHRTRRADLATIRRGGRPERRPAERHQHPDDQKSHPAYR